MAGPCASDPRGPRHDHLTDLDERWYAGAARQGIGLTRRDVENIMRKVKIATTPGPCESCGTKVAVTVREDDGAKRLSEISGQGRVLPGGHTGDVCRDKRS